MCERNPHCLNSRTLVLDTNFLDQVNRTIREEIASSAPGRSFDEHRPIFLNMIRRITENIGHCGGGLVYTTSKVYDNEIDITMIDSALRMADVDFFDQLCMNPEFTTAVSRIYQATMNIEDLTDQDVQEFQRLLSEDVGFNDASLVLLAVKRSQNHDVIILTDDLILQKAIKDLIRNGGVSLGGNHFSTSNLHYMGSLIFFRSLHACCEMSNRLWMSTVWSFVRHQRRRYEDGNTSEETYQAHMSYANAYLSQVNEDCDAKTEQEEMEQYRQMFGVQDEGEN